MNTANKDIVIIGTGGFAKEVLWLIEENNKLSNEWNIIGFIDKSYGFESNSIHGYNIIGNDEWLLKYKKPINVVCGIGNSSIRKQIVKRLESNNNIIFPNIISKDVLISNSVTRGRGCIICAGSILTVDIHLGDFVTINLDCTVGHDAVLKDYVTLYPSVNISGNVVVKAKTEIGTGTQIIQGLTIGEETIIGAGAVVIRDVPDYCTAVGNPAKVIKQKEGVIVFD